MQRIKNNDKVIKITALVLGVIFSLAVIFYFNKSLQTPEPKTDTEKYYTQTNPNYDPSGNLIYVPEKSAGSNAPAYDISYEKQKFVLYTNAVSYGYKATNADFVYENSILARVVPTTEFTNVLSEKTEKQHVLYQQENNKGGITYSLKEEEGQTPLLTPYYGYIIYTDAKGKKLYSSTLDVLVEDFSGYEPAYKETLSGNPLFIKDGSYYFYYNGSNYNGVVYSRISETTLSSLSQKAPAGAYDYFSYNKDLLLNMLAGGDCSGRSLEDVVISLEGGAGMVQYYPQSTGENDLTLYRRTNNKSDYSATLTPFCYHYYETAQTNEFDTDSKPQYEFYNDDYAWGYLDKDGNIAIEPQFEMAYPFSESGVAMIVDSGRISFIDTTGAVVYNPYKTTIDLPGIAGAYIHDGYYIREVNTIQTVGMFFFDSGYSMVRRKIVDSANGNKVQKEENVLISQYLETPNYPQDYNLIAYSDGMMLLEKNGYYGYMNTDGRWIVNPNLVYAEPFYEGVAVCAFSSGKYGMIDRSANTLLAFCYSHIESASGGLITAYSEELGWSVFSKMSTVAQPTAAFDPRIDIIARQIAQAKAENYDLDLQLKNSK